MPKLTDYHHFGGRHWETGSVHNHWAHRRFKAPHTQQPYSEALLMGISGGIVMGYFSFAYKGYDPHVSILTRNTFDPLEALFARLGVEQTLLQTNTLKKAEQNLAETLAEGAAPLVWADQYSLPYNALPSDSGMWQMAPLVVYGYEQGEDCVWISDRAAVPLTATMAEFNAARGRIKQDKFRVLTLEMPDADKLPAAVSAGIWSCIKLFTERPPKGGRDNFGFAAYQRWADLLTKPKQRLSWQKEFPPGRKMVSGLASAFNMIALFGQEGSAMDAERGLYADFLEEAALLLNKSALHEVATRFRQSGQAWHTLARALLPDYVASFKQLRELMQQRHRCFLQRGNAAVPQLQEIDAQLEAIKASMVNNFPLEESQVHDLRATLAHHILQIRDIEQSAIEMLKEAMQ